MAKRLVPDIPLLFLCALLVFAGVLILASVSSSFSLEKTGSSFYYFQHQALFGLLPGVFAGGIAFLLPLSLIKRLSFAALLTNLGLLALVFAPGVGQEAGGAHRWISVGSVSFQPSELLKLTFTLYLASWLASRTEKKKPKRSATGTLLPFAGIMSIIAGLLVLQPDVSTLGLVSIVGMTMYFLAGTPVRHMVALCGLGAGALLFLVVSESYRLNRLLVFLNPSLDPLGKGYQLKQALIGIGSGGLFGAGLGLSFQKFGTLPEPISDSVFAIFAEEAGFVGSFLLLFLFTAFLWRVFAVARRVSDRFSNLAAAGIGIWIFLQAGFNIGAMVGVIPLTGIPLPFISYGGSALFSELVACGILLNISKNARIA